ncbi:MAG: 5-formyltetrahydrofolate cyclo-ligase [Symbiobacteriaceae bacterium]|nr:5-formyltetrahydrofolate cyclo-ligase [Symbiobacteriaceae bacterium]
MPSKTELRQDIIQKRLALSPAEHQFGSAAICCRIRQLTIWQQAQGVLFFLPFRQEVAIEELMEQAWHESKRVYAPRCLPQSLELRISQLQSWDQLESGTWGIREPLLTLPEAKLTEIDLVLVPGAVFDVQGGRLGYGAGYYDRFLRQVPGAVKLAPHFSWQLTERLPQEEHDIPMDILVNENVTIILK